MAITYGPSGQPAQSTFNYDALVATSVANYRKTLLDNISKLNLFWKKIMEGGMYEGADGGLYIAEDLMYALAPVDTYDGYDELPLTPTEGITQAQFQWTQAAVPIMISEKERKQNKHRIVNLLSSKITQAEIGIQEFFGRAFMQGSLASGGSDIRTPYTSTANGSVGITPLFQLLSTSPTSASVVGGIDQATNAWWRNHAVESAATTKAGFLQEILNMYNRTTRGGGGTPNIGWTDQTTWELLSVSYYDKYRTEMPTVGNYPWPTLKFFNAEVVWDEFMPNTYANSGAGSTDPDTTTGGSLVFLNTKFLKVRYESETNFVASEFQRPINQDAKYKHILWMGNATINNRRKHGILNKIARTLS
jgi:hypothetical protein